jgi:uncharacterized protein YbjT (DUF2867 family)
MSVDTILVSGATGVLGREICRRLRRNGHNVRAMVRPDSKGAEELEALGCTLVQADLREPESLAAACEGVDQVVNTATAIATRRKGEKLSAIDRDGVIALGQAAEAAGVRHFLFVSIPRGAEPIRFFRHKRAVEAWLRASGMSATILQPTAFMNTVFDPANGWDVAGGTVNLVGDGRTATPYVAVDDVAKAAVAVVQEPSLQGREWPLAGPESLSPRQAFEIFTDVYGSPARLRTVPAWLVRGLSHAVMRFREDIGSIMQIASMDPSTMEVTTPPGLRAHLEPMVTVREFAERQAGKGGAD